MRSLKAVLVVLAFVAAGCGTNEVIDNAAGDTPAANLTYSPTPVAALEVGTSNTAASPTPDGQDLKADFEGTAGITEEKKEQSEPAILKAVRTAQHVDLDRVVFEFEGKELPGYHIEYIDKPVRACGSGHEVPLAGDGWLSIRFFWANAHTEEGMPTVKERERAPGHAIIKELKSICDFEGEVEWVLGVASPNRYRVLELSGPTRLVVDINHR